MRRDRRRVRERVVALSTAAVVLGAPGAAVAGLPGRLDRSFGDGGRAQVAFGGEEADARALAMQGHRAIVVGGVGFEADEDMAVIRLTSFDGARVVVAGAVMLVSVSRFAVERLFR